MLCKSEWEEINLTDENHALVNFLKLRFLTEESSKLGSIFENIFIRIFDTYIFCLDGYDCFSLENLPRKNPPFLSRFSLLWVLLGN